MRGAVLAALPFLVAGCYDFPSLSTTWGPDGAGTAGEAGSGSDGGTIDLHLLGLDLAGADFTGAPDQAVPADLPAFTDLLLPGDGNVGFDAILSDAGAGNEGGSAPDLAVLADLAASVDQARLADLGPPAADLVAPRDLAPLPDLVALPSCTDGIKNGNETDVDCGGSSACPPCAAGKLCKIGKDCQSSVCTGGRCGSGAGLTLGFATPVQYATQYGASAIAVADFNGDQQLDLVATGSDRAYLFTNKGSGTFQPQTALTITPGGLSDVLALDLNADTAPDFITVGGGGNFVSGFLTPFKGLGTGSFQAQAYVGFGYDPISLASGDFNGDNKPDLVTIDRYDDAIYVFLNLGGFQWSSLPSTVKSAGAPSAILVADFNNDQKSDLAVSNGASVSVLLGAGGGLFKNPLQYATDVSSQTDDVAAADLNGDGYTDLVAANNTAGTISVLLNNGGSGFAAAKDYSAAAETSALAIADFNLDGKPDIAALNRAANNVIVFLGKGDGTFPTTLPIALGLTLYSYGVDLAAADLNGDNKPDLAVATGGYAKMVTVLLNTSK